ncbi:hypothetical protein Ddc_11688 [Ditylenchus destructor]|nr:hypothetical protein Ddc_11688 [Ditylenchus destructor]
MCCGSQKRRKSVYQNSGQETFKQINVEKKKNPTVVITSSVTNRDGTVTQIRKEANLHCGNYSLTVQNGKVYENGVELPANSQTAPSQMTPRPAPELPCLSRSCSSTLNSSTTKH